MRLRTAIFCSVASLIAPQAASPESTPKQSLGSPVRVRRHRHRHRHHHPKRHHRARHFMRFVAWHGPVIASWYDDAGSTACGFHAVYGFASLILPCGAKVQMRGPGGTVTATMQDHGPYVGGRTFDLNAALKRVLGCSDLCSVTWRMG